MVGTLAAKQAASNLLPLSTTVGGMALVAAWEWVRNRPPSKRWLAIGQYVSLVVSLVYFVVSVSTLWSLLRDWPH